MTPQDRTAHALKHAFHEAFKKSAQQKTAEALAKSFHKAFKV